MKRSSFAAPLATTLSALSILTVASGCQSLMAGFGGKESQGSQTAELGVQVQSVHVEAEIAKQRLRDSVDALVTVADTEFEGNPEVAYQAFLGTIEESEEQAEMLRSRVEPMMDEADRFFAAWERSLDAFSNAPMRNQSRSRLLETRRRYKEIVSAVAPALALYDELNLRFRDHAVFLSHDFNTSALAAIQKDVRTVRQTAVKLDQKLDGCLQATRDYLTSTAPPTATEQPVNVASADS